MKYSWCIRVFFEQEGAMKNQRNILGRLLSWRFTTLFAGLGLLHCGAPESEELVDHVSNGLGPGQAHHGKPGESGDPQCYGDGLEIHPHGGPVMTGGIHVYYIWYGDWTGSPAPAILRDFAKHVGGSSYWAITRSYHGPDGTHVSREVTYGGSTTDAYSRGMHLEDADVGLIAANAIGSGALPDDPQGIYFVLTSKHVSEAYDAQHAFCKNYCGYHHSYESGPGSITYAFVGSSDHCPKDCRTTDFEPSPNGDEAADAMVSVVAHELEEAATDPYGGGWYDNLGCEVGDKCAWHFGHTHATANGARTNMKLGSREYLIQENWIDEGGGRCGLSLAQPPAGAPDVEPVYRWWNSTIGDHFYTSAPASAAAFGYVPEGIQFHLFACPSAGTSPFLRWWNASITDHFYTRDPSNGPALLGYYFEGDIGCISAEAIPGTVPLYRWWNAAIGDHFYTTDPGGELAPVGGYAAEGVVGYVLP